MSTNLFLKPDEAQFLGMAIASMLEDIEEVSQNTTINFTPEARRINKEMLQAGTSLKIKLKRLGIDVTPLPPYEKGDEKIFFN